MLYISSSFLCRSCRFTRFLFFHHSWLVLACLLCSGSSGGTKAAPFKDSKSSQSATPKRPMLMQPTLHLSVCNCEHNFDHNWATQTEIVDEIILYNFQCDNLVFKTSAKVPLWPIVFKISHARSFNIASWISKKIKLNIAGWSWAKRWTINQEENKIKRCHTIKHVPHGNVWRKGT
jgi:hypothetical protein